MMPFGANSLSTFLPFPEPNSLCNDYLKADNGIQYPSSNRPNSRQCGDTMERFSMKMVSRIIWPVVVLASVAYGQGRPPESVDPALTVSGAANTAPSPVLEPSSGRTSVSAARPTATTTPASSATAPSAIKPGEALVDTSEITLASPGPLPDLPPLSSHNKVSLIGGTVEKLDRVRDEFTVQVFGGGRINVYFDPRTHIYNNGSEASISDLRPGDRVSIDTMLDGGNIFARTIRLKGATNGGESQGVVVSYVASSDQLILRDRLSPQPLRLRVTTQTRVMAGGHVASVSELVRGTLVAVKFDPQNKGRDVATEIAVLATPGTNFTFVGEVTGLDLSTGLLVLTSATDGKSYEIYLGASAVVAKDKLRQAANVTVLTRFDGNRYVAQNVTVNEDSR
jgi:hypothetical protein